MSTQKQLGAVAVAKSSATLEVTPFAAEVAEEAQDLL
jgi:hypothetical protein